MFNGRHLDCSIRTWYKDSCGTDAEADALGQEDLIVLGGEAEGDQPHDKEDGRWNENCSGTEHVDEHTHRL